MFPSQSDVNHLRKIASKHKIRASDPYTTIFKIIDVLSQKLEKQEKAIKDLESRLNSLPVKIK